VLEIDGREFILVGTAHISRESAQLVRDVIERERPDRVCIELDAQRYAALSQKARWESLDLKQIIREKQLAALLANLLLASYQRKLGGALGVLPGTELLAAAEVAGELRIPISLCDRDVRVTLRRAWASMGLFKKAHLLSGLAISLFETPELGEEELRKLREKDVLSELMRELGEAMPQLKRTLIDERDTYLTQKMKEAEGDKIVAVVGAGHVEGIVDALTERCAFDLDEINTVPPVSPAWKWVGWGIPAIILGSLVAIGITKGADVAGDNLMYWIVANGVPCTIGAAAALAHPLTILAAFVVAPVTSLTPVIGAGYVLAFLQAYVRPPVVKDLERLTDDFGVPGQWWRNQMLRIFLVFILTTLGSLIGTYVGGYEIIKNLF
jgi:pheromone shutdown-related protein TraB